MTQRGCHTARIFWSAVTIGAGAILTAAVYVPDERAPLRAAAGAPVNSASLVGPGLDLSSDLMPLSMQDAIAANAALPFAPNAIEAAPPFRSLDPAAFSLGYGAALDCLSQAIYYEASGESVQGQRAVAQVVLNRVRHPAFPTSICEVVYQGSERATGCQFTFTCDGSLARKPQRQGWQRAMSIASAALAGAVEPAVGMATHYHAGWVFPYWAPRLDKLVAIDAHVFYRWKGSWGRRPAFSQLYSGEAAGGALALENQELVSLPLELSTAATFDFQPNAAPASRRNLVADLQEPGGPTRLKADQGVRILPDEGRGSLLADQADGVLRVDLASPSAP